MNPVLVHNLILATGIAVSSYFLLFQAAPEPGQWLTIAIFFAGNMIPFAALFFLFRYVWKRSKVVSWIVVIVSLLITGAGIFILQDAFGAHLDAQSGLVFPFLPIYQTFAVALLILILFLGKVIRQLVRG